MNFSVDDLVASLNSSHIGQEARDLATLQVQLAQTLYCNTSALGAGVRQTPARGRQPCTTPISRTPSSSMSRWGPPSVRSRRGSTTNRPSDLDEMDEDERMVEDLLVPASPVASSMSMSMSFAAPSTAHFSNSFSHTMPSSPISPSYPSSYTTVSQSTTSYSDNTSFATSDPFYLAQIQAANNSSPQSIFSQNGCIPQNSPFAHQGQYHHHPTQYMDSSALFQPCAAAF